ncbi:hypothetical protein GCM10007377_07920 [Galliscardovia ingluviei]|uniref:Putative amidase domain-containing protein n=1 Tax=Galliscardovia ingluviei TaxID=1769422 RepID=A0A8J3AJ82_9BIFI|nr:amidase domain-containing protein [Galliscardovia ingluviei]GGI13830.1 hypothetical protein GCM10007377_07920 [Galliscardovia ingluviei]
MSTPSKGLSLTLVSVILCTLTIPAANAAEEVSTDISQFEMSKHYTKFQGKTFALLDTFSDPEGVKKIIAGQNKDVLSSIQAKYSLSGLTQENATLYKDAIYDAALDGNPDINNLLVFLDYYENKQENLEIEQQLQQINALVDTGQASSAEGISLAKMIVPTKEENDNSRPVYPDRAPSLNLNAAREYARRYAVTPNSKYGVEHRKYFFEADCTNFASQILYAGGVAMQVYDNEAMGWWWKSQTSRSISWRSANTFKNYMGSGFNTRDWGTLFKNVQAGDFLGLDNGNDGIVDHIGFVFAVNTTYGIRIAQHTKNYLDWNGGWPTAGGRYYRVRR